MGDLEHTICSIWQSLFPALNAHPTALHQRLARRHRPGLLRPPRAWCLAVRASDARIHPASAIIAPAHALEPRLHAGSYLPHRVTVDAPLLRTLCAPVTLTPPGEPLRDVARKLGVHPGTLHTARLRGVFHVHHMPAPGGHGGRPIPLLYSRRLLDPASSLFAAPDPMWCWTATRLPYHIPDALEQTIQRIPVYRDRTKLLLDATHPEAAESPAPRRKRQRLPPPELDPLSIDYPDPHRLPVPNPFRRSRRPRHRRAAPSQGAGSLQFRGWRWICPGCQRAVRTLYYPLPPLRLFLWFQAYHQGIEPLDRDAPDALPASLPCFACATCHRVRFLSPGERGAWNTLITYLTSGLLYGHEVPRPESLDWSHKANAPANAAPALDPRDPRVLEGPAPRRRRSGYRPQSTRPTPRRDQVLRRLLNGWSTAQIARDLQITPQTVDTHLAALCKQHHVPTRRALSQSLGGATPPPPTQPERAAARRAQVRPLLLAGKSDPQIRAALDIDQKTLERDCRRIYRDEQVQNRRKLREKYSFRHRWGTDEHRWGQG